MMVVHEVAAVREHQTSLRCGKVADEQDPSGSNDLKHADGAGPCWPTKMLGALLYVWLPYVDMDNGDQHTPLRLRPTTWVSTSG